MTDTLNPLHNAIVSQVDDAALIRQAEQAGGCPYRIDSRLELQANKRNIPYISLIDTLCDGDSCPDDWQLI